MEIKQIRVENLKQFVEMNGGAASLSRKYPGIDPSYISQLLNGHRPFGEKSARNIESVCKLIPSYFDKTDLDVSFEIINHDSQKGNVSIPQYDASGSMGGGILLRDQSGIINRWDVSQDWIQKNLKGYTSVNNVAIVTGFGDSMKGLFNSGDPLIMDVGVNTIDHDAVYFFRVGNEGFIKRLQRIPTQGIRVISDNKSYESWNITEDMDFQVFGKILKAWHGVDL